MTHPALSVRPLLLAALVPCFAAAAGAQACGVRNGFRIANSHSGAGSELQVDTGWQTTAPLVTPGANSNPGATCSSQGTCTPTSDYGYLRVTGTGTANNCASGGVFLWLDQAPQARFQDTLTVVSTSLPTNTPVQLQLVLTLDGSASLIDPSPSLSYGANVSASSLALSVNNTTGTTTGTIPWYVGSSLQLQGNLNVAVYPYGLLGIGNPPLYSSYAVDLTARVGITCLTPGASLTFCSGHAYAPLLAQVTSVGGGCGPGSPSLAATPPVLAQTQTWTVASAPANELVFLAYSLGPAVATTLGSCVVTENLAGLALQLVGASDAAGACTFGLAIPATPGLAGAQFTAQTMVLTPNGPLLGIAQLSNGLEVTLGL